MDIVTKYNGISKFYFNKIIIQIIKLIDKNSSVILDYGCGVKQLAKKLSKEKVTVLNYDINPIYNEVSCVETLRFDTVVLNHVLMYMTPMEIDISFKKLRKNNAECDIIIGMSRENLLNKLLASICLRSDIHKKIITHYIDQKKIIYHNFEVKKKNFSLWIN